MSTKEFSFERLMFGNSHWSSPAAIDEIEILCDLVDGLQCRIDSLETRGKDEEISLLRVQSLNSSYAFEIAMKSLWAIDNPEDEPKTHGHNLLDLFEGLKQETKDSLKQLKIRRSVLQKWPEPFASNRYSMERGDKEFTCYRPGFLRAVMDLLRDKLEESRRTLMTSP